MTTTNNRIVSGMRPTGPLHLGHYFGVLLNYVELQEQYDCYYFVADWHALTTSYDDPTSIKGFVPELVKDWLAVGIDPAKCVMFQQSQIKEHAELHLLLSMITPVGWLERNPTYKEVRENIQKDLSTYGFLGYPVLQCTDIIMYKPRLVPVGQDQLPHLELTREIVRRFNHLYGEGFFPEPEAMLTPSAKLPGLDGRKMSKSYGNAIYIKDPMDEIRPKVMSMLTDTKRMRLKDPGNPPDCNLYPYLQLLEREEYLKEVWDGCVNASRGCGDCKKRLADALAEFLEPIQARRRELDKTPGLVEEMLASGSDRAREQATRTMEDVRRVLNFDF